MACAHEACAHEACAHEACAHEACAHAWGVRARHARRGAPEAHARRGGVCSCARAAPTHLEVALRGGLVRAHVAVGDAEVGEGAHILRLALERLHVARHRRLATHRVGLAGQAHARALGRAGGHVTPRLSPT
eukprot:5274815-Prymnesium_polylepis.1